MFNAPSRPSDEFARGVALPRTLAGYVLKASGAHQIWLCALSILVFLLNTAPLEIQRRILREAILGADLPPILLLAVGYLGVVLAAGLIKLFLNIYRGWVSESATLALRRMVEEYLRGDQSNQHSAAGDAVGLSMIVAESEAVGGFVGTSLSTPVLEGGFLLTVIVYLALLQPWLAITAVLVLIPQIIFVPLLQQAINRRVFQRITLLRQVSLDILATHDTPRDDRGDEKLDIVFSLNIGIYSLKFSMNFLMNLTYAFGRAVILGLGAWFVVRGEAEIATVVTFLSAVGQIVDPWNDLVDWGREAMVSVTKYDLIVQGLENIEKARLGDVVLLHGA